MIRFTGYAFLQGVILFLTAAGLASASPDTQSSKGKNDGTEQTAPAEHQKSERRSGYIVASS